MLLIIGEQDAVLFQQGEPESQQTLFEIYASLDQLDFFKKQTDKTFLEYASDSSVKNQNIFIYLLSDRTTFFLVVSNSLAQNTKKIKKMFKLIHYEFSRAMLEPLQELNSYVVSQRFKTQVEKILVTNAA